MNTPTPIALDNVARKKIMSGVARVYEPVRRTMGPQGGNALIYGLYSRPYRLTNDGYTVADIIELKDPHERLAAAAIQDAAKRTNLMAGDGTTCTTVLTGAMIRTLMPQIMEMSETADMERALKTQKKQRGVMDIKRDMFATRDKVLAHLSKKSNKIKDKEELTRIATISVENEAYGKTIADMAWDIGVNGYIDIVEGFDGKIDTEVIHGARFPAKVCAKVFVNKPERYEMEIDDAQVLLTNYIIDKNIMVQFLERLEGLTKLIIIAPNFKEDALVTMAQVNKKNGAIIYAPVKCPSLKTVQFEDIEVFTGAKFFNKDRGDAPNTITTADLGFLSKLIVKDADTREDCVALGGRGTQRRVMSKSKGEVVSSAESSVDTRVKMLANQMEKTRETGKKELLRRRIAGLSSSVGIIRVSADSEAETYYWKKKIEDAVYACRSALEEGYLPGGGTALKDIAEKLPKDNLLRAALLAPYEQIQENCGGIEITDDVIDPTKAIRCAVEHAVSVSANLLTARVIVPEEREKTPAEGYEAIAASLYKLAYWWAKEKAIIDENEAEIEKDTMEHHDAILRNIVN